MRIYVASSWRNQYQPAVVDELRSYGHEVYDFKRDEGAQFQWSEVDPHWDLWDLKTYQKGLNHARAEKGFSSDMRALERADLVVLVMPCGRSAHLEAGWSIGRGKPTCIYFPVGNIGEAELMYKMADSLVGSLEDVLGWVARVGADATWREIEKHL